MRKVAIFVGICVVVALAIGLASSWSWAALVVLGGLIPAGVAWSRTDRVGQSLWEWDSDEYRDRHMPH